MGKTIENNREAMIGAELSDLRRERELLTEELLNDKNNFANSLKDTLGEQLKKELMKKEAPAPIEEKKKVSKFRRFLDNITKIFA